MIAHQTEGRTRLRACERPADAAELAAFAERLAGLPGIDEVDCRPTTGSLVVEHPELGADEFAAGVAKMGGVIVFLSEAPVPHRDALAPVRNSVGQVDGMLSQLTAGGADTRTLAFVLMLGLAVRQIMQGQVMVPAFSLLWWAYAILRESSTDADASPDMATD